MNKAAILALIDAILKERISNETLRGQRGPRGPRGLTGRGFEFVEHEAEILNLIKEAVSSNKDLFQLSEEDKEKLKLTYEQLTQEQKESLRGERGPRGQRGKPGQDFNFEEYQDRIYNEVLNAIEERKQELKLQFSELTEDEKKELSLKFSDLSEEQKSELQGERGPRGQRGRKGEDGLSAYQIWSKVYQGSEKDFIDSLRGKDGKDGERGPRGQRGKVGATGDSAYELWLNENSGSLQDFLASLVGKDGERGPRGIRGSVGPQGLTGRPGVDGKDGVDAPTIIDIEVFQKDKNSFILIFKFSDGTELETEKVELPSLMSVYNSFASAGSGGSGGPDNFSYTKVLEGETLVVPENQQMLVWEEIEVDGNLDVQGEVVVLSDKFATVESAERLTKSFIAGENIAANKIVRLGASQQVFLATNDGTYEQAQAVGFALNNATTSQSVSVLFFGVLESNEFNFTINNPFFLGANGNSIQNPPTAIGSFVTEVGQSLGVGAVFLDIQRPVEIVS